MATRVHPSQINSFTGNVNLLKDLEYLQLLNADAYLNLQIQYNYDTNGNIVEEVIKDMNGNTLKLTSYSYDVDGNVLTETVSIGGKTITKTFQYNNSTITSILVTIV